MTYYLLQILSILCSKNKYTHFISSNINITSEHTCIKCTFYKTINQFDDQEYWKCDFVELGDI